MQFLLWVVLIFEYSVLSEILVVLLGFYCSELVMFRCFCLCFICMQCGKCGWNMLVLCVVVNGEEVVKLLLFGLLVQCLVLEFFFSVWCLEQVIESRVLKVLLVKVLDISVVIRGLVFLVMVLQLVWLLVVKVKFLQLNGCVVCRLIVVFSEFFLMLVEVVLCISSCENRFEVNILKLKLWSWLVLLFWLLVLMVVSVFMLLMCMWVKFGFRLCMEMLWFLLVLWVMIMFGMCCSDLVRFRLGNLLMFLVIMVLIMLVLLCLMFSVFLMLVWQLVMVIVFRLVVVCCWVVVVVDRVSVMFIVSKVIGVFFLWI